MAESFPIHVAAEWLGNSPKTALAHDTQVTEEHYRQAAGVEAAQNPAQQGATVARTGPQPGEPEIGQGRELQALAAERDVVLRDPVARAGLEPARLSAQPSKSCMSTSFITGPRSDHLGRNRRGRQRAAGRSRSASGSSSTVPSVSGANRRPGPNAATAAAGATTAGCR